MVYRMTSFYQTNDERALDVGMIGIYDSHVGQRPDSQGIMVVWQYSADVKRKIVLPSAFLHLMVRFARIIDILIHHSFARMNLSKSCPLRQSTFNTEESRHLLQGAAAGFD